MTDRCGICGRNDGKHDPQKHALFERMRAAPGVIEPLSPLKKDLEIAKQADVWVRKVTR